MLTLKVDGMTCQHCSKAITQAIQSIDKEAGVQVDLSQGLVNIQSHAPAKIIRAAVEAEGYEVIDEARSAPM